MRRLPVSTLTILTVAGVFSLAAFATQPAREPAPKPADQPATQPETPAPARGRGQPGEPANLEAAMKQMNGAYRRLHPQIADAAKRTDNLRMLSDMQRACIAAKGMKLPDDVPALKGKDDAAKVKLAETFRRDLIALAREMLDVEENLLDGKYDAAKTALEDFLTLRDTAHKTLGVKDKD